jgi:hypothetical protein
MSSKITPAMYRVTEWSIVGLLLCLGALGTARAASPYHKSDGTEIVVNSRGDLLVLLPFPGRKLPCTLRDAIRAANDNVAVGGCKPGLEAKEGIGRQVEHVDHIVFDLGPGTPTIYVQDQLPPITEPVSIDGATGGATRVGIDGSGVFVVRLGTPAQIHGLILTGQYSSVENMVISNFSGNGILITDLTGDGHITTPPTGPELEDAVIDDGRFDPCGPYAYPRDPDQCPPPGGGSGGPDIPKGTPGGGFHYVAGNLIGTDATGTVAAGNGTGAGTEAGIAIGNHANLIGGPDPTERNVISGNRGHGLIVGGTGNRIEGNYVGTDVSGKHDLGNQWDGVHTSGGQLSSARPTVAGNVIAYNAMNGVSGGYNYAAIISNSIFANDGLGIDMADPGVTLNHPIGARTRPPNAPELVSSRLVWLSRPPYFGTSVTMDLSYQPTRPVTVELFHSPSCDPSGYGEGQTRVASVSLTIGGQRTFSMYAPGVAPGQGYFTATATGTNGGKPEVTSEFSACLP